MGNPANIKSNPTRFYATIFAVATAVLGFLAWHYLAIALAWSLLLAGNVVAFSLWAFDKRQAKRGGRRVPEVVLHLMAILGATPASLVAMHSLRHKTLKRSFTLGYSVLLGAQILALLLYLRPPSS